MKSDEALPELQDNRTNTLDRWRGGIFDKVTSRNTDEKMKTADESQEIYANIIFRVANDDQYKHGTSIDDWLSMVNKR